MMDRIAISSDIHGNLPALQATLQDIARRGITRIFCLGDLIGKGPHSDQGVLQCLEPVVSAGELDRPLFYGRQAEDIWYRELGTLTAGLPPAEVAAARDRGRAGNVWEMAAELLAEVESAGYGSEHAQRMARLTAP